MPSTFAPHDHHACIKRALDRAEAGNLRLTPVRRRTLEILLESHAAMGAYEILARLKDDGLGDQPPVVYRALGYLTEHGLVHRIERLNAFVACARPDVRHDPAFLVCRTCRSVAEAISTDPLDGAAGQSGFAIERTVVEAEGLCPDCQAREP